MFKPNPATSEAVEFTGLEHRAFIPEGSSGPVFLLVHGRTGDSSVMWSFARTFSEFSPIILAPQAPDSDPLGGFSWWPVATMDGKESARVPIGKEAYLLAVERVRRFLERAAEFYRFSPTRVHAMGFSQGAGLISGLSLFEPERFGSVALLAGFVPKALFGEEDLRGKVQEQARRASARPSFFIGHGTADEVISIERAREGERQLIELGYEVQFVEDSVGHKVGSGAMKALGGFYQRVVPSR